jgi:3-hydroxyisobutyrate dehydrogenase
MGAPMALAIQKSGVNVVGVDVSLPAMDAYVKAGGKAASDAIQEASDADMVVLVPNTAQQATTILFGGLSVASGMTSSCLLSQPVQD